MATRFELFLYGENTVSLRAAGEEALREIERLDKQLNLYNPLSEIAYINARAAGEPVRVEPGLFALLERAHFLHQESGGTFDITIAPLLRCWGLMGSSHEGKVPSKSELAEARQRTGMNLVKLDPEHRTVRFAREGVMLDLGAIGKGYAVERAAELLREAGVTSALLHGGTSTVYGLGYPPTAPAWNVAIEYPAQTAKETPLLISIAPLRDEALSVSAVWGKSFQIKGKTYGHIIDPRTGQPAARAVLAAVVLHSATESDALSTALLNAGLSGHDQVAALRAEMKTLVMQAPKGRAPFRFRARGIEIRRQK
jgi:thiamine biosynthesis lipoprotein